MNDLLKLKIEKLPTCPGCYLMKSEGRIIYVGKAVNLKNRVRSYFRDTEHTPKVAAMISHIDDFDILLCDSNLEALCLECNLIKLHKPYYNILLKDDKHYPYLRVNLKEPFPRLTLARRMEKDGAKYFGPYIGATAVRQVIDAVRGVFPLRTCRKELPLKTPCRPCVNYEIGKCLAPCAGKCTEEQYWDMMDGVLAFLGGDYKQVLDVLNREMMDYAAKMQYERAAVIRDKIRDVQGLMERQIAIQTDRSEQDILAIAQDGLDAMIQLVYVRGGRMVGGDHFSLPREGSEPAGDVLAEFLTQYYQEGNLIPRNILVQELPDGAQPQLEQWLRQQKGAAVTLVTPRRGEKHDLVLLAAKNAPPEPEPDPEPDPDPDPDPDPVPGFDGDTMVVVPNPVGEALTVYVPHVASMEGTATIYDAAARKVLETTITVDAEGKGTLQVGGLSPGAYSLSVEVGGKSSKVSFMKR